MIEVQRIAQESQREVRDVVRGYREIDLEAELSGARGVLRAAGIDCEVSGETGGLPTEVQSALGWVVREATTNVLRHSGARSVTVELALTEDGATLTVTDDGRGPTGGNGAGLAGLAERVAALGGTVETGAAPGRGFRLRAVVPVPASAPTGVAAP